MAATVVTILYLGQRGNFNYVGIWATELAGDLYD
jgi:hypothetical protein